MGYGDDQLRELAETIDRVPCDVVVTGTPFDLGRLIDVRHPLRHARYTLRELGEPTLEDVLAPIVQLAHRTPALAWEKGASS
jgi:predicted GTPase